MGGYRSLALIGLNVLMCGGLIHFAVTKDPLLFVCGALLASVGLTGYAIFGPNTER